jgi:hypothetical protein
VSATRLVTIVLGATLVAFAATSLAVGCKNGDYDGSFDGGASSGGATVSHVVQPDKTETFASTDGVIDVTFGAGTFADPATITITAAGEQTLESGLIVPIFIVSADKKPAKFFQVSFHGAGNGIGGQQDRALVPALRASAGAFTPLEIAGTPTMGGGTSTYWGLTSTFGMFSLASVSGAQTRSFAETASSCTGQCCHPTNGGQVVGFNGGCLCATDPDLACFLAHCTDLAGPAARCSAIGAGNNVGSVDCKPFGATNCPGGGCPGYSGTCGNGGGNGGGGNNFNDCCIVNKNSGRCVMGSCAGFSARCTAATACPASTTCCVFETESYCAADCPAAQRACSSNAECTDAGADAGTCRGGACPVAVCGTPPGLCQ